MELYFLLSIFVFTILILSITDCGNNSELRKRQKVLFKKSVYRFLFISFIFLLWFLTAFRDSSIGNDTVTYLGYFDWIDSHGVNGNLSIELGFQYIYVFLSKLTTNPYSIVVFCATVCYLICGWYIYKYSENILFSLVMLFCLFFSSFTNIIRQALAMVIVLIAYEMIKKGKKISAVMLILLASLFHISALITFLWFAHEYICQKPKIVISCTVVLMLMSISGNLDILLSWLLKEYQGYFSSEYAGNGWLGVSIEMVRALVFCAIIYIAHKKTIKETESSMAYSNAILMVLFICLGFTVNIFSRICAYFMLPMVVEIPNAFNTGKVKNRNLWMMLIGGVLLACFIIILIFRPEWNALYPYKFWITKHGL